MRVAMLSPVAWRTPPRHYGPWELMTSLLTEGLVERGVDVTLFATADSLTEGALEAVVARGWEESEDADAKVLEALHLSHFFERAGEFDVLHNQFDFLPLSYSRLVDTPMVTTIHGFSSKRILPVYEKYDGQISYVSISHANRAPSLTYAATIYHGIDLNEFTLRERPEDYLLFFGRMHPDKGPDQAIAIAKAAGKRLIMAGIIQDARYFEERVRPHLDDDRVRFVGAVGPEQRDRLLGGAEALLHPIGFDEPFGLSVVEAQACGTPVIAYERGSMAEVIQDEETGFLVRDVAEAAQAVGRLRQLSRRACRAHVEARFSRERMVSDYIALYAELL